MHLFHLIFAMRNETRLVVIVTAIQNDLGNFLSMRRHLRDKNCKQGHLKMSPKLCVTDKRPDEVLHGHIFASMLSGFETIRAA